MGRGFRIFLLSLLGFCVAFGAFCIVYPLARDHAAREAAQSQPAAEEEPSTADPAPEEEEKPEEEESPFVYAPAQSSTPELTQWQTQALERIQDMTLEEKVYQLFIATPEALTGVTTATVAGDATRTALEAQPVGGIIYFAKNLIDRSQTSALLSGTASFCDIAPLLCVDEEGGTVSRVGSNAAMGVTHLPDAADYTDAQTVYEDGKYLGGALLELGFNLDFAPVADVVTNPNNTEIGSRSYSSDPETAAQMVGSMVSGLKDAGILCSLKHFPGHGGTETDTHDGRSVTQRTLEEMWQSEFLPFRSGIDAGAPMVMVGHLSAPSITGDDTPADLSPVIVTDILRQELHFSGVIVTDAQNMGAITDYYTSAEAAVGALKAGVDMILMPADLTEAVEGVLAAVESGELSQEQIDKSVTRILAMKYQYGILS